MKEKKFISHNNYLVSTQTVEHIINNIVDNELTTIDTYNLNQIELQKAKIKQ